jgi:ribulose-phosphate 3-epimerase
MKTAIVPAILAKTRDEFFIQYGRLKSTFSVIQIDIADNKFVKNKTIQASELGRIKTKLEAHLMVRNPENYIDAWQKAGAKTIIFHYEACRSINKINSIIEQIKNAGLRPGIAINPETSVSRLKPFMDKIDLVLVMTVHPGWQGQSFLSSQLRKVSQIRKWSKTVDIEVDGGINPNTAKKSVKAGANRIVVGSYLKDSANIKKAIAELKK